MSRDTREFLYLLLFLLCLTVLCFTAAHQAYANTVSGLFCDNEEAIQVVADRLTKDEDWHSVLEDCGIYQDFEMFPVGEGQVFQGKAGSFQVVIYSLTKGGQAALWGLRLLPPPI